MTPPPEAQYSAFPFLSQVTDYVRKEIERRDKRIGIFPRTPFIKATPGYKVDEEPTPILKGIVSYGEGSNPSELKFSGLYNKDLAFRPRAGITNLVVEYQNIVGSVRKATLSWNCHSVKDLQALSKYFMHPGMTLLIEWGWSDIPPGILSATDKYTDDFKFVNYFKRVRENTRKSSGRYDAMLGYIKNYSFTMRSDGGFDCTTEMASTGDLMQGILLSQQKDSDGKQLKKAGQQPSLKSIIMGYLNDVVDVAIKKRNAVTDSGLPFVSPETDYENGVFVLNPRPEQWGAPNPNDKKSKDAKDTPDNSQLKAPRYFSWGFIEDYILNPYLSLYVDVTNGADKKALYAFDSSESKIGAHRNLRTIDLGACIVPFAKLSNNTRKTLEHYSSKPASSGATGDAGVDIGMSVYVALSSKSNKAASKEEDVMRRAKAQSPPVISVTPNLLQVEKILHHNFVKTESKADGSQSTIYTSPRNILVNEELLKSSMERSIDPLTFVSIILAEINNKCGNYWELRLQATDGTSMEDGEKRPVSTYTVVDLKYSGLPEQKEDIYTFRIKPHMTDANGKFIDTRSSIVKTMKFTSNLSNQAALNVFYKSHQSTETQGQYEINGKGVIYAGLFRVDPESKHPSDRFLSKDIGYDDESIDKKDDPQTPGDYEGDQVGYHPNLKLFLPLTQYGYAGQFTELALNGTPSTFYFGYPNGIEILYIQDARDNLRTLCMLDGDDKTSSSSNDALTPMNLEMELEGIAGLRPGDMFDIDNAPEIYRKAGVFQIKAVNQTVDKGIWLTKITAQYRVTARKK